MLDPQTIIDLIAANVRKTRNPFGVPHALLNSWWRPLDLKLEGDTLLFTGLMYQSVPYIERTTGILERMEDTHWASILRYGRWAPKGIAGLGLTALTPSVEKQRYNKILRDIARILIKAGVEFAYRPEIDRYSGVLLYDLGDTENFIRHGRWVARNLKNAGIRRLITVDPHTTYALKVLYPRFLGESFEVRTYFELIDLDAPFSGLRVTLHDPCFYGRYLELADKPRKVLEKLGVECTATRHSGAFTHCCGGPAESVSPRLSREILDRRVAQLAETGDPIVAMCPICLGNLRKAGMPAEDLSTLLHDRVQAPEDAGGGISAKA